MEAYFKVRLFLDYILPILVIGIPIIILLIMGVVNNTKEKIEKWRKKK